MTRFKPRTEPIERVTLKLPRSVATYLRATWPHGRRSDFVADCILKHKKEAEIKSMEEELRNARDL